MNLIISEYWTTLSQFSPRAVNKGHKQTLLLKLKSLSDRGLVGMKQLLIILASTFAKNRMSANKMAEE